MTKKLQLAVTLSVVLVLFSCDNKPSVSVNSDGLTDINVGIEQGGNDAFMKLTEDVRFIPLETSDDVLIGEIDKIIYYGTDYYVAEKSVSTGTINSIYRFDSEGRFLNRIGIRGRGPGEYADPTDFVVNSSGLIVLDNGARRLLFYDYDGTYKKTTQLEYILYEITGMPDENLIFAVAGDNRYRTEAKDREVLILDINGKLISAELPYKHRMNFNSSYKSFRYNDEIIYSRPFHKFVYSIDQTGPKVKYSINMLDSPLPANYEEKTGGNFERFMDKYERKYNYFVGSFLENDDAVFFITEDKERLRYWNIYDKRTQEVNTGIISPLKLNPPLSAHSMILMSLNNNCLSTDGEDVIGYLNASYLSHDEAGFRSKFPSLKNVKPEDNPVIFRFRFK